MADNACRIAVIGAGFSGVLWPCICCGGAAGTTASIWSSARPGLAAVSPTPPATRVHLLNVRIEA
jgi:hypothetical protein